MKNSNTPGLISMIKTAKLVLFKVLPLSVTTLFAASAFAGSNCPGYLMINNYIKTNELPPVTSLTPTQTFVVDAPNTDWKLRTTASVNDVKGAALTLKSITAKRVNTTNKQDVRIKSISCEYSNAALDTQGKSISLEMTTNGRLTVDSYILNSISLNNDWNGGWELPKTAPFDAYICKSSALTNQCGGFEVKDHLEGQQRNAYWADAWKWCWRTWPGCYYKDPNSYTSRMMAVENKPTEWTTQECNYYESGAFPMAMRKRCYGSGVNMKCGYETVYGKWVPVIKNPYCKDAKCTEEIAAMNGIVAPTIGGDQGMAHYLNMSWAGTGWVNKVPDPATSDMDKPTGTWPDYTSLE